MDVLLLVLLTVELLIVNVYAINKLLGVKFTNIVMLHLINAIYYGRFEKIIGIKNNYNNFLNCEALHFLYVLDQCMEKSNMGLIFLGSITTSIEAVGEFGIRQTPMSHRS